MNNEIESIKRIFESHQVLLSNDWLESCISWCKEENLSPNYTLKELQLKVYEQWLLLDLRDVEVPCLPPGLESHKKFTLNGNFSLQMMKVVDISKPKYWQLQNIRNNTAAMRNGEYEKEAVGTGKRVLQLTLNDGVQSIEAVEYKPINSISLNLTPGVKIRLAGPITIRRGRLMLEEHNVKILGGEVEDLVISNAAENILAKSLNLPLNPKPGNVREIEVVPETQLQGPSTISTSDIPKNENIHNTVTNICHTARNAKPTTLIPQNHNQRPFQDDDFIDEEELRIAAEMEMLLETELEMEENMERSVSHHTVKQKITSNPCHPRSTTPDLFDDLDIEDFDFDSQIKKAALGHNHNSVLRTSESVESAITIPRNSENNSIEQTHILGTTSSSQETIIVTKAPSDKRQSTTGENMEISAPIPLPKKNVVSIEKLNSKRHNITRGVFKIKAKFKTVEQKLTVSDDEFKLTIKVQDDTGDLLVNVHSDIVSQFAGYSPSALMSLKSGVMNKDENATSKVIKAIQQVKEKLISLDNIMEIHVNSSEPHPTLVKLL